MRKIKILHYCNQISLGGTERAALTWCKYLDKIKFEVFFAVRNPKNEREVFCREIGLEVFKGYEFTELIKELGIDIIHLHRSGTSENMPFNINGESPVIIETNVFNLVDYSDFNEKIKAHLFMSKTSMDRYFSRTERAPGKYYDYLYNPVEQLFFENSPERRNFKNIIGRASREDPWKWGRESLWIAHWLKENISDYRYRIIGATPLITEAFELMGVTDKLDYLPQQNNDNSLIEFYNSLNVFVHSAQIGETFGSVIAEAMSRRLPVVTLRLGGKNTDNAQEELVDHYKTGFVAGNFDEFCCYTLKLLKNPSLAEEMGRLGHKKAANLFHAEKLTRKLERIYSELAEKFVL